MTTMKRKFIYKIVPTTPKIPLSDSGSLPKDYLLPASDLDKRDGFMHTSTPPQVPNTLNRFFKTSTTAKDSVYLFRVLFEPLDKKGMIKWEYPSGKVGEAWGGEDVFPHIYDGQKYKLGPDEVESVVEVVSEWGEENWDGAMGRVKEWLV